MAITTNAITNSFKEDLLNGLHDFSVGGDVYKLALYTTDATIGADTTSFTSTEEVANPTGSYSTGGGALVNALVSLNGTTAFVNFDNLSFTGVTLTAAGALIYNTSEANKSVCVLDFAGNKTATAGTFTIQFPAVNNTQAIIRIS
jgi:hypothetical protein